MRLSAGRRAGVGVLLALGVGGLAGAGWAVVPASNPPAHAQEALIESDPAVVRARADLEAAQQAAHQAEDALEATTQQKAAVEASIADHQQKISALDAQRAELAQERDTLLDHLRQRAVALYSMGSDGSTSAADLFSGSVLDGARRKQLGDAASRADHSNAKQLEETRKTLADTQAQLRTEQDALQQQQTQLDSLLATLQSQQAELDQRVAEANAALDRARAIGALHAAGDPVMGPNTLTADQMVAWFDAQGYRPRLSDTSVPELAQIFLEEGAAEGVRGDFAFAQAIIETGGFSAAPDDNYSGLGWCDGCARGIVFPTPRDGVRGQIQLLVNYADSGSRAANLHNPLSPYVWSSTAAFDNYFAKGWAPTWSDMGHGNWATDPNYSGKVIGVYNSMVAFAG
ncbi:MAG TPA: glucosaminidase domain-containing protein [Acidimicrobiia bacterium]|jgi:predicted  nucleic acid-binding Zn-ribbon protein|nr:glucosaminidase domain-containing protein [Acidimicrobiia bacterium]